MILNEEVKLNCILLTLEKSWDCFPHTKTVVTSPFLGEKFFLIIESMHAEDRGEQKNILNLDAKTIKDRSVSFIDIALDQVDDKTQYRDDEDPKLFRSKTTERGPLNSKDWTKSSSPVMCCYKLVKARCKLWGVQSKLENYLMNMEKDIFLSFHKRVFCWMDDWYPLTYEQILESEEKYWKELADKIQHVKETNQNENQSKSKESQPEPQAKSQPESQSESQAESEPESQPESPPEPQVENDIPPHDASDD